MASEASMGFFATHRQFKRRSPSPDTQFPRKRIYIKRLLCIIARWRGRFLFAIQSSRFAKTAHHLPSPLFAFLHNLPNSWESNARCNLQDFEFGEFPSDFLFAGARQMEICCLLTQPAKKGRKKENLAPSSSSFGCTHPPPFPREAF